MAATSKTTNYDLPIYKPEDITSWTTDFNEAMTKIDTQMKSNADVAETAQSTATEAKTAAEQASGEAAGATADVRELTTKLNAALERITTLEGEVLKVGDTVEFRANNKIATITHA